MRKRSPLCPLLHVAAHEAYLAVFHAAEAYIFEQTGKVARTHRGMQSACRLWRGLRRDAITGDEANAAIATTARFSDVITRLLFHGLAAS